MNVKLIKMWSGEDVIADLVKETDDSIVIFNPIVVVPAGQLGQVGLAPWSPLLKGKDTELEVTRGYVVYINEPQEEFVSNYRQMFTGIATPPKKLILLWIFVIPLRVYTITGISLHPTLPNTPIVIFDGNVLVIMN